MTRAVHHLEQGSPEWHAHRATPGMHNGSELSAERGLSKYVSRSELLHRKATGIEPEYDAATLARFADGHAAEALARPLAEEIIDDDLSAMVMTDTIDGVLFSVSLDGITQDYRVTFEHKRLNTMLADALDAGHLPEQYHDQCEAGLMVSGAAGCLFMASKDGDKATMRHIWYYPNSELRAKIIASCKQFDKDLAAYTPEEKTVAPVAATIEALPALFVQVEGKVLATNLDAFKASAQTFIDNIKTSLSTDQDFADADKMVKFLKDGEDRLALAKQHALSQTASIDELFRTVDAISEQMRSKRLALDKLVKAEKDNRKIEILNTAQSTLRVHVSGLNKRIGGNWMPSMVDGLTFSEAIKGLKSLDSMRDKVSDALANAKIEANEVADRIEANRKALVGESHDFTHLVPDFALVCTKPAEDFLNMLNSRAAAESARIEAAAEAARKEEAAKLEAQAKAEAARLEREVLLTQQQADFKAEAERKNMAVEAFRDNPPPSTGMPTTDHFADTGSMIDAFFASVGTSADKQKNYRVVIHAWEGFKARAAVDMEKAA